MNIYRLWYREQDSFGSLNDYNILSDDLESAFAIGRKLADKDNPGMVMECMKAEEIARNVITAPRRVRKTA